MKLRKIIPPSAEMLAQIGKIRRLERLSLVWLALMAGLLFALAGESRLMLALALKQTLMFLGAGLLLLTLRFRNHPARERFPYGFQQATPLASLLAAVPMILVGLGLTLEGLWRLFWQIRPTVGSHLLGGQLIWSGWLMIGALTLSALGTMGLGLYKLRLARLLYDKALYAEAMLNRRSWRTALAGGAGIYAVGIGWWWADALVTILIGWWLFRAGLYQLRRASYPLLGERPTELEDDRPLPEIRAIEQQLKQLPWVLDAAVRLRQEGQGMVGEGFLVPLDPHDGDLLSKLDAACASIQQFGGWRLHEIVLILVPTLHAGQKTSPLHPRRSRTLTGSLSPESDEG